MIGSAALLCCSSFLEHTFGQCKLLLTGKPCQVLFNTLAAIFWPDRIQKYTLQLLQESAASGSSVDSEPPLVHTHHFEQALQRVGPSVSRKDQRVYDALRWQLRSSRGHLNPQVNRSSASPAALLCCRQLPQVTTLFLV